ncbi:MAG TPA: glycosyltransferase family 2 protein, partial [Chitinophagaceae bacterium]|nr:glycosyltransferase family 2 protein [Chitinophagaceae bacterium]
MPFQKLSILIPCFNEENLIVSVLENIIKTDCGLEKEIIIVNDCSSDNTTGLINSFIKLYPDYLIKLLHHKENRGKGACIQTALAEVTGEVTIIQDADLEYNPSEYAKMLQPIADGFADVVYGSRFRGSEAHRVLFFFHTLGNKLLTFLSNLLTGINLTDMETGYKMFRTEI